MEVPRYSLAERDRRWALARQITVAENVQALIAYGGPRVRRDTLHPYSKQG
jgi:hypothetical protein